MNMKEGMRGQGNRKEVLRTKVDQAFAGRFQEKDFVNNPFSQSDVNADLAYVSEQEAKYSKEDTPKDKELKETADMFEALVLWNAEMAEWFGHNATTIKTSKYDDYKNGVDMIVTFQEGKAVQHLGLAADVTFSSDPQVIVKKFNVLRNEIKNGTLAKVKYYHSGNYHGQLSKLPEVILGVSAKMVHELAGMWADGKNKSLANHRVGVLLLRQIEAQLSTFEKYAKSMGQVEASQIYADRLEIIQGVLKEKAELVAQVESAPDMDPVHLEIMKTAQNWSRY